MLDRIVQLTWDRIERSEAQGRTVTLKLKHDDFSGLTRARTLDEPIRNGAMLAAVGHALLDEVLPLARPVRLVGLTLSHRGGAEAVSPPPAGRDAQLSLL